MTAATVKTTRRTVHSFDMVNRTGFLEDLIAWEDGVYGTSKSVFAGGA